VPDDPLEQAACLAYLTDMLLLSCALGPHQRTLQDESMQFATINHSVWFHAPLRVDDWFLYDQESRWAGGARAIAHGEILDRTGRLCATTMQEGLLRLR
jgi:acyl-CoA thioesterase-2